MGIEGLATGVYTQKVHQFPWLFNCYIWHSSGRNLVVRQIVVFWLTKIISFSITNGNWHDHRWFWQYIKGTRGNKWAHRRRMCWEKKVFNWGSIVATLKDWIYISALVGMKDTAAAIQQLFNNWSILLSKGHLLHHLVQQTCRVHNLDLIMWICVWWLLSVLCMLWYMHRN